MHKPTIKLLVQEFMERTSVNMEWYAYSNRSQFQELYLCRPWVTNEQTFSDGAYGFQERMLTSATREEKLCDTDIYTSSGLCADIRL
jgi:hypothetical protein